MSNWEQAHHLREEERRFDACGRAPEHQWNLRRGLDERETCRNVCDEHRWRCEEEVRKNPGLLPEATELMKAISGAVKAVDAFAHPKDGSPDDKKTTTDVTPSATSTERSVANNPFVKSTDNQMVVPTTSDTVPKVGDTSVSKPPVTAETIAAKPTETTDTTVTSAKPIEAPVVTSEKNKAATLEETASSKTKDGAKDSDDGDSGKKDKTNGSLLSTLVATYMGLRGSSGGSKDLSPSDDDDS